MYSDRTTARINRNGKTGPIRSNYLVHHDKRWKIFDKSEKKKRNGVKKAQPITHNRSSQYLAAKKAYTSSFYSNATVFYFYFFHPLSLPLILINIYLDLLFGRYCYIRLLSFHAQKKRRAPNIKREREKNK